MGREDFLNATRVEMARDGAVVIKHDVDLLGAGNGVAPTGRYSGFIVGGDGATITAITHLEPTKYAGSMLSATFPLVAGQFYPVGFSTLTITAGALMLIKEV
jgi:hypothetical protein